MRPLFSITFPKGFQKSKKVGHWTLKKGGKKTFKLSEQMQKNLKKIFFVVVEILHPYGKKFSNLRPLLSITFPKGFRKSKKFGHWTLGNGDKKKFERSEQMKKSVKTFVAAAILHPLWAKVFKSDTTSFYYFNLKSFDIWLLERGQNTGTKKILLSKVTLAQKTNFFCTVILHLLLVKVYKSEATSFHYFSPRTLNL